MAEKDIMFTVGVNTGNTAQDMAQVDKSIEQVDKSVTGLNEETAKAQQSATNWGAELKKLDTTIKNEPINIQKMNKQIQAYQSIALNAGRTSAVGIDALKKASDLKDRYVDIQNETKRMANDHKNLAGVMQIGQATIAGYGAFKGAMTLAGVESESLQKTMVKLQAVQTVTVGINQLKVALEKESAAMMLITTARTKIATAVQAGYALVIGTTTGALKIMRIAMIATGIGALIVGIGLLIANFKKVSGWISKAGQKFNELGTVAKTVLTVVFFPFIATIKAIAWALEALGIVEGEEAKQSRVRHEAKLAQVKEELAKREEARAQLKKAYEDEQKNLDRLIVLAKANGEETTELTKKKINGSIAFQKEQIKEIENSLHAMEVAQEASGRAGAFFDEAINKQKESLQQAKDAIETSETDLLVMDIEAKKKRSDAGKKASEDRRKQEQTDAKKQLELERLISDLSIANIEDQSTRELAMLSVKQQRQRDMLRIKYGEDTTLELELKTQQTAEFDALELRLKKDKDAKDSEDKAIEKELANEEAKTALELRLMQIQGDFDAEQELKLQLAELERTKLLENDKLTANERLLIEERFNESKRQLDKESVEDDKAKNEALITSRQALVGAVAGVFGQLAGLAKEGSKAGKALALTEIGINTAVGFINGLRIAQQGAVASGPGAPFAFPVFLATQFGAVLSAASKAKAILGKGGSVSAPTATGTPSVSSTGGSSASAFGISDNNETDPSTLFPPPPQPVLLVDSVTQIQNYSAGVQAISTVD